MKEMTDEEVAEIEAKISDLFQICGIPKPNINPEREVRGDYELLTNFELEKISIYAESLERYNRTSDNPRKLKIDTSSPHMTKGGGLWIHLDDSHKDLSFFWRVFDLVKKRHELEEK